MQPITGVNLNLFCITENGAGHFFVAVTENAIGASHLRKVGRRGTASAPKDRFEEGI
jgi:hypothetical protein